MEQHPIPQNVTGFQFKLVGDITLKQFVYIAGCLLSAYLFTKLSFIPNFIRYPIAGFMVFLGIGLAFIPIEERPLDRWIAAFFKSIYSPTQFIYKKNNLPPEILSTQMAAVVNTPKTVLKTPPQQIQAKSDYIASLPVTGTKIETKPVTSPIVAKNTVVNTPKPIQDNKPASAQPPIPKPSTDFWRIGAPPIAQPKVVGNYVSSQSLTGKKIDVSQPPAPPPPKNNQPATTPVDTAKIKHQYQQVTQKLSDQIASLQKDLQEGTIAKERLIEIQQVLTELVAEKERLSLELIKLQKQLLQKDAGTIEKPSTYTNAPSDSQSTVKMVSPQSATQVGMLKLTDQVNVITGIIKTSEGTLLPNIIVTVKDKEGVPVRALKTNRLGQFAASTPLSAGIYIIEVEDPKKTYKFHRVEINLINEILPALEISAVSERDIIRQKLTQELFGKNKI